MAPPFHLGKWQLDHTPAPGSRVARLPYKALEQGDSCQTCRSSAQEFGVVLFSDPAVFPSRPRYPHWRCVGYDWDPFHTHPSFACSVCRSCATSLADHPSFDRSWHSHTLLPSIPHFFHAGTSVESWTFLQLSNCLLLQSSCGVPPGSMVTEFFLSSHRTIILIDEYSKNRYAHTRNVLFCIDN